MDLFFNLIPVRLTAVSMALMLTGSCAKFPRHPDGSAESILLYNLLRTGAPTQPTCRTRGFCYMFKTAVAQADAQSIGGVSSADTICSSNSARPAAATNTVKALLVAGTTRRASISANAGDGQIDWVLWPSTQYRRADGTTIIGTTQPTGLFTFPLAASFGPGGSAFHAGLTATWTTSGNDCGGWTNNLGTKDLGDENNVNSSAIFTGNIGCANPGYHLMCVEQ